LEEYEQQSGDVESKSSKKCHPLFALVVTGQWRTLSPTGDANIFGKNQNEWVKNTAFDWVVLQRLKGQ